MGRKKRNERSSLDSVGRGASPRPLPRPGRPRGSPGAVEGTPVEGIEGTQKRTVNQGPRPGRRGGRVAHVAGGRSWPPPHPPAGHVGCCALPPR